MDSCARRRKLERRLFRAPWYRRWLRRNRPVYVTLFTASSDASARLTSEALDAAAESFGGSWRWRNGR